jgi:hypothetical protein
MKQTSESSSGVVDVDMFHSLRAVVLVATVKSLLAHPGPSYEAANQTQASPLLSYHSQS